MANAAPGPVTSPRKRTVESTILSRRSWVRVGATWAAALFLFGFGPILILALLCVGETEQAIDLFMTVLPVAASIVSFWFAGRDAVPVQPKG